MVFGEIPLAPVHWHWPRGALDGHWPQIAPPQPAALATAPMGAEVLRGIPVRAGGVGGIGRVTPERLVGR